MSENKNVIKVENYVLNKIGITEIPIVRQDPATTTTRPMDSAKAHSNNPY